MNRHTRDYCRKNFHPPNWKPWRACYGITGFFWDMEGRYPVTNGFLGRFCIYCGGPLEEQTPA